MKTLGKKPAFRFLSPIILTVAALVFFAPCRVRAAATPSITTQPRGQSVVAGSNAAFTVVATGQTPLFYQWSFNGTNLSNSIRISGATDTTLIVSNIVAGDAGNYQVVVSNDHGSVTSSNATLTVLLPPRISTQLLPRTVRFGQSTLLAVALTGNTPITYSWYQNRVALSDNARRSGSGTSALSIANVQSSDAGDYMLVASNAFGVTTSAVARLTVVYPGTVATWGSNVSGQTNVPPQLVNPVAIAAGGYHSLAIQYNGSVVAWGDDTWGQTNVPASLTNALAVAAGHAHAAVFPQGESGGSAGDVPGGQFADAPSLPS